MVLIIIEFGNKEKLEEGISAILIEDVFNLIMDIS